VVAVSIAGITLVAQTPQPFPRPAASAPAVRPVVPAVSAPAPQSAPAQPAPGAADVPTAATLGISIYPSAQFLGSYDAGRAQRYYLFGTPAAYAEVVAFYQTQFDDRGDVVLKDPPTHMFDGEPLPRFRDETMAFPPSVTVKDFTSGGRGGYPNPKLGAQPAQFPTVVMIVPAPPGTPAPR
jgi:hypothetical protein